MGGPGWEHWAFMGSWHRQTRQQGSLQPEGPGLASGGLAPVVRLLPVWRLQRESLDSKVWGLLGCLCWVHCDVHLISQQGFSRGYPGTLLPPSGRWALTLLNTAVLL